MTRERPWDGLPAATQNALASAWRNYVPSEASALHARWWQFETWLRSLAYVELRAKYGSKWLDEIPDKARRFAENEAKLAYMTSPDAELILAYLDLADLFSLVDAKWELFKGSLIEKSAWMGRTQELRQIRHRIGHCRRPHTDDLARVEQMLRDLEKGTFRAVTSFNDCYWPKPDLADPIVDAWVREAHPTAQRLIKHAENQYDTSFRLHFSRRPWANQYEKGTAVTGREGYFWHATFSVRGGADTVQFWKDWHIQGSRAQDHIVFACFDGPSNVDLSFSALDDPVVVADAIGECFDALLTATRFSWAFDLRDSPDSWHQYSASLDPRVLTVGPWLVDKSMQPITLFSAG
ncbi:Swt1 family HEPN domain-containing protein [Streptosporangium sp. DT93]|uniref:Swt1 family HEPN domain-containing protein n=1 Tax=Streptosporangium sp. DT93 TaxID=3393428 RepID=UPI003CF9DBF7